MTVPAKNLLVELRVEELPPKALKVLGIAFAERLVAALVRQQLTAPDGAWIGYATPRRLAVFVPAVLERAPDRAEQVKLMPVSVGLDAEGRATPALLKKLAALGTDASALPALQRRLEGKAESLFLDRVLKGRTLAEGLQAALAETIEKLPIPKVMTYQLADGWTDVSFVRPAHGLVALHGADVVPVTALGLEAGRTTEGHRFEAARPSIELRDADGYAAQLRDEGAVIAGFDERRALLRRLLDAAAAREGLTPIQDDALLDEVTGLVERPNVLLCRFEPEFLAVPPECLILTMKANQKYFPLLDAQGRLTERFLVVSNISPADPSRVVEGNERVVRPRLADAKFFYEKDRKTRLDARVAGLDKVVYHGKLGTQGERVLRVREIARWVAERLGADMAQVDRAAELAKADLLTDMVGEFPELQGTMGGYYAKHDGETDDVASAVEDHYKPRFSGDTLPRSLTGVALALADKLETVIGLFGAGQVPSGDKDPFGLRRQSLGIVRLLVERRLPVGLLKLIDHTILAMPSPLRCDRLSPLQFILDRATGYFEEQGFDKRAIAAVLGPHGAVLPLGQLPDMLREATRFIASPEGLVLAESNKRITNILKKSGFEVPFGMSPRDLPEAPDAAVFQQDEERSLFAALLTAGESALSLRLEHKYAEALSALAPLSAPTKAFFDKVMVNADDPRVRDNRITLLQHARAYMNQVADLTLMAGA